MNARHLTPIGPASQYPTREITEEREVQDWTDAVEEIRPLNGSWLTVEGEDRLYHFSSKLGTDGPVWEFRSMILKAGA